MAFNLSSDQNNNELPKIKQTLPKIKVKSDAPKLSLEDDNLFFNINGSEYSIDYVAGGVTNLFFND